MNLEALVEDRKADWDELDRTIRRAGSRPERLGAAGVRRLGRLYRSAVADLALVRRRYPGDPVVAGLERLVIAARPVIYSRASRRGELRRFLSSGYWRRVRERPQPIAVAWGLLLLPAALTALWAVVDPTSAVGIVPDELQGAADPPVGGGVSGAREAAFTAALFTHNITVTFSAFALGITAGLGTALLLAYNGALLGALGGLAFGAGNGNAFVRFVAGHGMLELSCIAVTSAAGLRLGWSWVSPGTRRRLAALAQEGRAAVEIVLGTMPWLVLAGAAEAYVRPIGLPLPIVVVLGAGLAGVYWGLVLTRGRVVAGRNGHGKGTSRGSE